MKRTFVTKKKIVTCENKDGKYIYRVLKSQRMLEFAGWDRSTNKIGDYCSVVPRCIKQTISEVT